MNQSAISWTDYSGGDLNFVTGCTPVSEGCRFCFAEAIYYRFGRDFSRVIFHSEKLRKLWNTKRFPPHSPKRGAPHRSMCFIVDTGDLFHKDIPPGFLLEAFAMMTYRDDVTWQILTKRAERMQYVISSLYIREFGRALPPHIWLGVSVENQQRADERISILLDTPAAVRFVSIEPMLEPIWLGTWLASPYGDDFIEDPGYIWPGKLDWVIVGAESGPHRRPFDPAWAKSIYEQCQEAGVSFFGKQDSGLYPGKPLLIDGKTVHEWPDLTR